MTINCRFDPTNIVTEALFYPTATRTRLWVMTEQASATQLAKALKGLEDWALPKLNKPEVTAQTHGYESGDELFPPQEKEYLQVIEGEALITTGEDVIHSLSVGAFIKTFAPTSKFKILANSEPMVRCAWYAREDLGITDDDASNLQRLEAEFWQAMAEHLAVEAAHPQTAITLYEPGDIIIREGDNSDCIYEMIGGEAEVLVAGNVVGQIKMGEFFGEYTFLVQEPRSATVRAISHCTIQEISAKEFEQLIQNRPQIMLEMARELARRLHSTNQKVDNLKSTPKKSTQSGGRYRIRLRT